MLLLRRPSLLLRPLLLSPPLLPARPARALLQVQRVGEGFRDEEREETEVGRFGGGGFLVEKATTVVSHHRLNPLFHSFQPLHLLPQVRMVEGHQVARTAAAHRATLRGRRFRAESPNGRFAEGARAVDRRRLLDVQSVGKQLFYFFEGEGSDEKGENGKERQVVAVHFGMSGRARVATLGSEPERTATTRLRLVEEVEGGKSKEKEGKENDPLTLHVACMTLLHSRDESLWRQKRAVLGPDPLRADADAELVFEKMMSVRNSKKSVGLLLMSQDVVAGIGNIYRAEICHLARVRGREKGEREREREKSAKERSFFKHFQ